jgi:hypothetical protein
VIEVDPDHPRVSRPASGTALVTFNLALNGASDGSVRVRFRTIDGTAVAGTDYLTSSGEIDFPFGATSETVSFTILGAGQSTRAVFYVSWTSLTSGAVMDGHDGQNDVTIVGEKGPPRPPPRPPSSCGAAPNDQCVVEVDPDHPVLTRPVSGTVQLTFTLTLDHPSDGTVRIGYRTVDGTATAGTDYVGAGGELDFPAGATTESLSVTAMGGAPGTGNRVFDVDWTSLDPSATMDGDDNVTPVTIRSAGGTPPPPPKPPPPPHPAACGLSTDLRCKVEVHPHDATVARPPSGTGTVTFTLTLDHPSDGSVAMRYRTIDGTAHAGADYLASSGELDFPVGSTTATASFTILAGTGGPGRTFTVAWAPANGAAELKPNSSSVSIGPARP